MHLKHQDSRNISRPFCFNLLSKDNFKPYKGSFTEVSVVQELFWKEAMKCGCSIHIHELIFIFKITKITIKSISFFNAYFFKNWTIHRIPFKWISQKKHSLLKSERSRCVRADSVLDSHTTGPGFKTQLVRYFLLSFRLTALSWAFAGVCGRSGKDFPVGSHPRRKMGSCVFKCDVPHQWIAQRQVGPVSVYCDGVGCRVLCLRHGISVWQHIGQSTTATSRHRRDIWPQMFQSDVKPKTNKQTNKNRKF